MVLSFLNTVSDRIRFGRPRVVRTLQIIKVVRSRINRNPVRKKIMTREMDIVPRTMSRIIKQDLLGTFNQQTGQRHTVVLKENRGGGSRPLLLYGKEPYKEIF